MKCFSFCKEEHACVHAKIQWHVAGNNSCMCINVYGSKSVLITLNFSFLSSAWRMYSTKLFSNVTWTYFFFFFLFWNNSRRIKVVKKLKMNKCFVLFKSLLVHLCGFSLKGFAVLGIGSETTMKREQLGVMLTKPNGVVLGRNKKEKEKEKTVSLQLFLGFDPG